MNMIRNILCVFPVVGDTKDAKRVDILKKAGYRVTVVAFERDYYASRLPECKIITIGKIENRKYFKRILLMLSSLFALRRIISKYDAIYALSPDLAFMSYLSSIKLGKPIIMDVADIREIQVSNSLFGHATRVFDRVIGKACKLLVVTSEAFVTKYYEDRLKITVNQYYVLENKVDYDMEYRLGRYTIENKNKIRIGYFGVLRDDWTVELLLGLLRKYPHKYEVHLSGINMIDKYNICELDNNQEGFTYSGPYSSPSDLHELYDNIDIMAIFYPENKNDANWYEAKRICRSNRFYEACYFQKPILAFSYSEDGRHVENMKIGHTLSDNELQHSIEACNKVLVHDQVRQWVANIERLPKKVFMYQCEHSELRAKINKIL
jgi:succinoglycan biosynthesis protein ExoL